MQAHPNAETHPDNFVPIELQARKPWFTYSLIATFIIVFLLELMSSKNWLAPNALTLVSMGALSHTLILEHHEWHRLLSSAFLHGSYMHLFFNSFAMFMAGASLEILLGRRWVFILFILSALGGAGASLLINTEDVLSVGASGGVMGLIAALYIVSFRLPKGKVRSQTQLQMLYIMVPALLPIFTFGQTKIDYAAHFGGAITGALLGVLIYVSWIKKASPNLKWVQNILASACGLITVTVLILTCISFYKISAELEREAQMVPQAMLQEYLKTSQTELPEFLQTLEAQYPADPRVPYLIAIEALKTSNLTLAEEKLRQALGILDQISSKEVRGAIELDIRILLASILIDTGKTTEAKNIIAPICEKADLVPQLKDLCEP